MSRRSTRASGLVGLAVVGFLLYVVVTACDGGTSSPQAPTRTANTVAPGPEEPAPRGSASGMAQTPTSAPAQVPFVDIPQAKQALQEVRVKGRAPLTGYDREAFGTAWSDTNDNGCDTRNDILRRDLRDTRVADCVVMSGVLDDPYSGDTVRFVRGPVTSLDVQIDHVVALSNAWQTGAARWDAATREQFANDRRNLLAVRGDLNLQKGDGDAATWLPPRKAFRCTYVAMQTVTKQRYGLWMTPAEKVAVQRILDTC